MFTAATDGPLAGLKPIDSDSHFSEPGDLWTSRTPAKYKDQVPQVRQADDGHKYWYIYGQQTTLRDGGASVVLASGEKMAYFGTDLPGFGHMALYPKREEMHRAAYDARARVELLDELGIWAQIVYPNVLTFATPSLIQSLDREFSYEIIKIYNDAIAEWQDEGTGRLYPQAILPFWDIDASIKEAQRAKELGLTGVTMAGEPHLGGLPDLGQPIWDPLYEAISDLDLPIDIHIGARNVAGPVFGPGVVWESASRRATLPVFGVQTELANSRFVTNLVTCDLLLRWPKLRWVSVESGIGWIPYVLQRMDSEYQEDYPDAPPPDLPPAKEMFQRGIYGCFWFEEVGSQLIEAVGENNIMWETDFPHPTCLHPNPVARTAKRLEGLSPIVVKKIMQDNAAQLYKIPL